MGTEIIPDNATDVDNHFIANYPPFSIWNSQQIPAVHEALDRPAADRSSPLGLYLHIPFCRQRCKFCYFRVYTQKNADDVEVYLDALAQEAELYANRSALIGRDPEFVYFGGGTPSFLSSEQLLRLIDRISKHWRWESAREVTFECEPGTFRKAKLDTIKAIGVTRLSLGIEHFDDEVLSLNGRGHKSPEIFRAYELAREVGFDQINIDLIAGMIGDNESKWKSAVTKAVELDPSSVTIYQLELPHNTVLAQEAKESGKPTAVLDPRTIRAWVDYAFRQFEQAGYLVSSAYTLAKKMDNRGQTTGAGVGAPGQRGNGASTDFMYRDSLWHGADMIGMGVASFSYVDGVHFQNSDSWEGYVEPLKRGEPPISRAFRATDHQKLIREMILQLKLGRLDTGYFRRKFGVEITDTFSAAFASLVSEELAVINGNEVCLTRPGLLRADGLLPRFFEPEYRNIRYT